MIEVRAGIDRGSRSFRFDGTFGPGLNFVVGPSGAGKSTLLELIVGFLAPKEGEIRADGRLLASASDPGSLSSDRRGFGFAPQDDLLMPHLGVAANIAFGRHRTGTPMFLGTVESLAGALEISGLLSRRPSELSGGERKRAAIARAVVAARSGLLLDEPLSGLNQELQDKVVDMALELARRSQRPIVIASHHVPKRLAGQVRTVELS